MGRMAGNQRKVRTRRPSDLDAARHEPPVDAEFLSQPVLALARRLVGGLLLHKTPVGWVGGRIVETEAYRGPDDRAAHSYAGRRTRRTEVMYGPAGRAYLFFLYGMHWNFNVVAGAVDQPHAVLVRGLEPIWGVEIMAKRRGLGVDDVKLTNGPGKLCQALGLNRSHYGADLTRGALTAAAPEKQYAWRAARASESTTPASGPTDHGDFVTQKAATCPDRHACKVGSSDHERPLPFGPSAAACDP